MYIAVDVGAGSGVKVGFFSDVHCQEGEALLPLSQYGPNFASFAAGIVQTIDGLLQTFSLTIKDFKSIGIATAGILASDGTFQLSANMPQLNGHNLKNYLAAHYAIPTEIDNDANAGALAEWSVMGVEIIYWVFGGGWGGAWVNKSGEIKYPSHDWDGKDHSLHYSNEPGYAIPLDLISLENAFHEVNASFSGFRRVLEKEFNHDPSKILGPDGDPHSLRAEVILSGPGRVRLFRSIVGDDCFYNNFLSSAEQQELSSLELAGKHISKLSNMRVEAAVNTDRLYGKILAKATSKLLQQAYDDGMPEAIPICLGGKPSYALPYFGPAAQRVLGRMGYFNYMRPSVIDERGLNANMVGAAVLAQKAYEKSIDS